MNETLIIENVNLEDLEDQRMILNEYMMNTRKHPDTRTLSALSDILAMLDEWSDDRYFEGLGKNSIDRHFRELSK